VLKKGKRRANQTGGNKSNYGKKRARRGLLLDAEREDGGNVSPTREGTGGK